MTGKNLIYLCTLLCSIIFINHVNGHPFGSDPFGDGFGSNSGSSHNRMHDPFGNNNDNFGHKFPSDPFSSSNSNFGGSSGFGSNFGSSGHSSFGSDNSDPFSSDFFQNSRKTSTTTDSIQGIQSGFEKLGEAFQQAAGVGDKAITITRNITDKNSPISSITFTSGLTHQQHNEPHETSSNVQTSHNEVPQVHYSYRPPSTIYFHSQSYPVYSGTLPPYVYEYITSGNKYSKLLAGLALYNLGKVSTESRLQNFHDAYVSLADEVCMFGVSYKYKLNDEMKIDCKSITSFLIEEKKMTLLSSEVNKNLQAAAGLVNTNIQQLMNTVHSSVGDDSFHSSLTKSYKDSKFNGRPVDLESDMECFVSRTARFATTVKQTVPCDLLQTYSNQSLVNSATMTKSTIVMLIMSLAYLLF